MSTLTASWDRPPLFLRRVLVLDAVASGATAMIMIAGAQLLDGILGLPAALLRGAGLILLPYVAFVVYTAVQATIPRPAVWAIIAANAAWAAASALLLISGLVDPTKLGYAFVIAQAVVVAVLGELQYMGLRRPMATV